MRNHENPEAFRIKAEAYNQHVRDQHIKEEGTRVATRRAKSLGTRIVDRLRRFLRPSDLA